MHITYEFKKDITHIDLINKSSDRKPASVIPLIDQRITHLRREMNEIRQICAKLSGFIKTNSMTVLNDDLIEYLELPLNEEKQKRSANKKNDDVIENLEQMVKEHKKAMKIYSEAVRPKDVTVHQDSNQIETVFDLVKQLYRLPINGKSIEEQVQMVEKGHITEILAEETKIDPRRFHKTSTLLTNLQTR